MSEQDLCQGKFLRETPTWGFANSDQLGGNEDNKGKKPLLAPKSPTPNPTKLTSKPSMHMVPQLGQNEVAKCSEGGTSGGSGEGIECKCVGASDDHEVHILIERERRKKMREMFTNLHAMIPHLPSKADKSTIIDEAVSYIKTLENTLQKLQRKKLEKIQGVTTVNNNSSMMTPMNLREAYLADHVSSMNLAMTSSNASNSHSVPSFPISFQTWSSPNFVLNVCGEDAQIGICAPKKPGLLTKILSVLDKHRVEVITVQVSSDCYRSMFMILAHARTIPGQFQEALSPEEIFKLAVTEMTFCILCF